MTEENEPHNHTIELLRIIQGELASIRKTQSEHGKRFNNLERQIAAVRGDSALIRGDIAILTESHVDARDGLADLTERVERLERRADLDDTLHQ